MRRFERIMAMTGIVFSIFGTTSVWASTATCGATGQTTNPKRISCFPGQCDVGGGAAQTCAQLNNGNAGQNGIPNGRGTFPTPYPKNPPLAGKTFAWCACPGEAVPTCCFLAGVLDAGGATIESFEPIGSCTPCPASGNCSLQGGTGYTAAECINP